MAGKTRPRAWAPLDVDFLSQDTIRELAAGCGPVAPLAFIALILEAHKQALTGPVRLQGEVVMRYSALAIAVGVGVQDARAIVARACELGLLDVSESDDGRRFRARLLKWGAWEAKDLTAADRQAAKRQREAE